MIPKHFGPLGTAPRTSLAREWAVQLELATHCVNASYGEVRTLVFLWLGGRDSALLTASPVQRRNTSRAAKARVPATSGAG